MSELLTDKKVEDIDNFSSIKPVTAANLSNTLKIYRNLFITWYEMYGFHFADIEKYLKKKKKINPNDEFVVIDADSLPPA